MLRENVYRLIDQALETGHPIDVKRKGQKLFIVPEKKPPKLSRLVRRKCLRGDPEKLVHTDWTPDPFDRLIVAQARVSGCRLITKDRCIHRHFPLAVW